MNDKVLYRVEDGVAYIIINNGKYNLLDIDVRRLLLKYLDEAGRDSSVKVIVLTGNGENFSAGADLRLFTEMDRVELERFLERYGTAVIGRRIRDIPKPVIAVVRGYCIGGGLELIQYCDIILASEDAKFAQSEVRVGLIPGGGGTQNLPRLIGDKRAREMIYTGRIYEAREMEGLGLVNRVYPMDELMDGLRDYINELMGKSMYVLAKAKEALNIALEKPLSEGIIDEGRIFRQVFLSEDGMEGVRAFLEKRRPKWR